jgi:hypothetical protein
MTHNGSGLLLGWYLKNVRPATELVYKLAIVGLTDLVFGTVDLQPLLIKI